VKQEPEALPDLVEWRKHGGPPLCQGSKEDRCCDRPPARLIRRMQRRQYADQEKRRADHEAEGSI